MSDIPSLRQKIQQEAINPNSPVSQYLFTQFGGAINSILDGLKIADSFLTPGSTSWTVTVPNFLVFMCGGGGGGGAGGSDFGAGGSGGGGAGGGGSVPIFLPMFNQTVGGSISLTVGAGGAGGVGAPAAGAGGNGSNGGQTSFGSFLCDYGRGGAGGPWQGFATPAIGGSNITSISGQFLTSGGNGGDSGIPSGVSGQRNIYALGGVNGSIVGYNGPGGGGGAGFLSGGNGGDSSAGVFNPITGGDAAANSGAGGGGSGGAQSTSRGGNGGSGFVYILYF